MKQGDRVQEVTNTVGTGALTLLGSTGGHRSFLEEIGEGFETTYIIKVDSATWEISRGTLTGTTLTRTLVKSSTGSLLDLPAGTHYVTQVLDAATVNEFGAVEAPLTLASGTITANEPALNITQTWNNAGVTFEGMKVGITNTAAAAASRSFEIKVSGNDKFVIDGGSSSIGASMRLANVEALAVNGGNFTAFGRLNFANGALIRGTDNYSWSEDGFITSARLTLARDANDTLAQRRGTNAQTTRIYNTFTDASNYERLSLHFGSYSGATYAIVKPESGGTGTANMGLVLGTMGTGAITAQMPDGTIAGGNARGSRAIDLQLSRTAVNQVASGENSIAIGNNCIASNAGAIAIGTSSVASGGPSFCLGWTANTASGLRSMVLGGRGNTSSAQEAVASGFEAVSNKHGQWARGATRFATDGDAQYSDLVLRIATTDAAATEMLLFGQAGQRAVVPANTTWAFTVTVVARQQGGTNSAHYIRRGIIGRDGANNTALVGTVEATYTNESNAAWDVAITADDTNEALKIDVTGAAATNIRWVAKIDLVEVGFPA